MPQPPLLCKEGNVPERSEMIMTKLLLPLLLIQGPPQPPQREAPAPNVSFDRILKANQEPQNWLTYSVTTMSQAHSLLTQITPANAKDREPISARQPRSVENR